MTVTINMITREEIREDCHRRGQDDDLCISDLSLNEIESLNETLPFFAIKSN